MHKWVAGWHTPEPQSEFALQLAPTVPPPLGLGMHSSSEPLHMAEPQLEFALQLGLGGCTAAALIMHK
jgi:hypothetical protein